jgi:mannose-6-phosphate isomerase-like protein (cupin superfamily)
MVSRKTCFEELKSQLPLPATAKWPEGIWDIEALKHGTMSLILFAPKGKDYQTLHEQDEIYIILSGSGTLAHDVARISFSPGDVLFVPAGMRHNFESFTQDLVTWAVFWGPEGTTV